MTSELSKVPTLDLNKFNNGSLDEQKHFVSEIGDSFNQIGFAIIKNHGLDSSLVDNLYDQIKNFFYLEDHIKKQSYWKSYWIIKSILNHLKIIEHHI